MIDILLVSLSVSVIIVLLLALAPLLNRCYRAKWWYFVWLLLAVRLIIPFSLELPSAFIRLPMEKIVTISRKPPIQEEQFSAVTEVIDAGNTEKKESKIAPLDTLKPVNTAKTVRLSAVIFAVWATGAAAFLALHIFSYLIFKRRVKPYCEPVAENIYRCTRIMGPVVIGFFRPKILLPDVKYTQEEMEIIIKHEMVHFKRKDAWYKLILLTANAVHWFNPFVYAMVSQANRDLEYSCDDLVVGDRNTAFRKYYSMIILKTMGGEKNDE